MSLTAIIILCVHKSKMCINFCIVVLSFIILYIIALSYVVVYSSELTV